MFTLLIYGYRCEFHPSEPNEGFQGYAVVIPSLPGCMSQGDSIEDAIIMIKDAMMGWMEVAIEDGLTFAPPDAMGFSEPPTIGGK